MVRGNNVETEEIQAYAPVAIAGLGWLPDTILSRSVIVGMRRRHAGERVEPYRRRVHERQGYAIRNKLASWARSATVEWPTLPDEIQDRDADVWEPLIAIAGAVGGECRQKPGGPLDLNSPDFDRPNAFVLSYPLIDPFLQFNPVFGG